MASYRVLSLNLWNRFGPWEARLAGLVHGLDSLEADLVGVQELVRGPGFDQASLLTRGKLHTAFAPAYVDASGTQVGNGLFSRFPIVSAVTHRLPQAGTPDPRSLLEAHVETPWGNLPVFVTHLTWRLDHGHVRALQARAVADVIEASCPSREGLSPVLIGDFNAEPDSDEMRFFRGLTGLGGTGVFYQDAFLLAGRGDGTTFSKRNPFAAPLREPERRIDYVFVRGHDDPARHGEILEARVCMDEPYEGTYPTDHFAVLAEIGVAGS